MRLFTFPYRCAVLTATLGALACSSDSAISPGVKQTAGLSQLLGEFALPALNVTAASPIPMSSVPLATAPGAGCSYVASSQSFACPPITAGGVTITLGYVLLSASGTSLPTFDAATVASIRSTSSTVGSFTDATGQFTVNAQQTLTLSGLQSATHKLNGGGASHFTVLLSKTATAPIGIDVTTAFTDVVLAPIGAANSYPLSGSLSTTIKSNVDGLPYTANVLATFNGTAKVLVTVTTLGVTQRCTIDLAAGKSACG